MKALSLALDLCPELIPVSIVEKLGDGADGEVFTIEGTPEQVIKFSVVYDYDHTPADEKYSDIDKTVSYLRRQSPCACAQVYTHDKLAVGYRNTVAGQQKYILHYYIMEKCLKISSDEKKVFHTILSHEDREIKKNWSRVKVEETLTGLSFGLDFDREKVLNFWDNVSRLPMQHTDIHPRNIMKRSNGEFCLIDFDRCKLTENEL